MLIATLKVVGLLLAYVLGVAVLALVVGRLASRR